MVLRFTVENQFITKWEHNTNCPTVRHIYKITAPADKVSAYESYRYVAKNSTTWVGADYINRSFVSQSTGLSEGNQRRRFHGTNRMCTVGDGGSTTLCSSPQCSLCCIVKTSFKLNKAGGNKTWMGKKGGRWASHSPLEQSLPVNLTYCLFRFGLGIYTSATSSKYGMMSLILLLLTLPLARSNDYSENKGAYSNYKAFFLTKVDFLSRSSALRLEIFIFTGCRRQSEKVYNGSTRPQRASCRLSQCMSKSV